MGDTNGSTATLGHSHVFLGEGHEKSERKTWAVIWLCGAMMIAEIVGGLLFGSIALVADGLHMSTHAGALLLAALAYTYARKHAEDPRFSFGTGKLGDLAGFTSAIILAMIALLIGYESVTRIFAPVPIHFTEAIPIACLGLAVNIASAWLLSGGGGHRHDPAMAMATATSRGRKTTTMNPKTSRRLLARCASRCSRTACLPAFACARNPAPPARRKRSRLKPSALTEQGRCSSCGIRGTFWSQSPKFLSRMPSPRMCGSGKTPIRSLFRSTIMPKALLVATTTYAPP
jgi:Co/Zn/Cd efflux system component